MIAFFFNWLTATYLVTNSVFITSQAEKVIQPNKSEQITPRSSSEKRYQEIIENAKIQQLSQKSMDNIMQSIADQLLGATYKAGLLDQSETEKVFISLTQFDCVLFIETVLALSHNIAIDNYSYSSLGEQIVNQRYRNGTIDGYCSRLHYFSDWIYDNQKRGNVRNITADLGGIPLEKTLNFMTTHRTAYPQLVKSTANYDCIQQVEKNLQNLPLTYIPTNQIEAIYPQLQAGDIIGVVTSIKGLDTTHTGLIYRDSNGKIGLIHASPAGNVTIAPDLYRYIRRVDKAIGIFVVRPVDPRK